ncbi:MAG: toxic anion resistance protein [Eubacterium sp.]|nr:toxic anion resistance protein [Eubacterium sp.]
MDEKEKELEALKEKELEALSKEDPVLSFDEPLPENPFELKTEPELPNIQQEKAAAPADPLGALSETERAQVDAFVEKIDLYNSGAVINYGAGTQKKMAAFSEKALENVRTKDMGEVGTMITNLVNELKNLNVDEEEGGLRGFFKKKKNNLDVMKAKYTRVEGNVQTIKDELEKRQIQLIKDSAVLDKMYDLNLTYFKELTMYIAAGKKKLDIVRNGQLAEMTRKAEMSGLPEDAQKAKDLADLCDRFEKKIYDLELTRTICLQTSPQIRLVQASNTAMAEKIQSTIVNTIPLWKNQMVIALGLEHSTQAAKAQRQVSDMTNELLKKNATQLKMAVVETAKESERGIVDIETLKETNATLLSTLDEVLTIQIEGKKKRAAAQAELAAIEGELKKRLLQASRVR